MLEFSSLKSPSLRMMQCHVRMWVELAKRSEGKSCSRFYENLVEKKVQNTNFMLASQRIL